METESEYLASLLRACARGETAAPAAPAGLDWSRLGQLLVDHLVVTTLAPLLRAALLPPDFRARLEFAARETGRGSGLVLLELERVLTVLNAAGCEPIVLKGAGLALTAYAAPEQRLCRDLDLLVPPDRLAHAEEVLRGLGLSALDTGRAAVFYEKHHFHRLLRSPVGTVVELHWALTLPDSCYRFDLEGLRARARTHPMCGSDAVLRLPAPRDQLLHAVMQCIADGFIDLRRVLDTVLLLREMGREGAGETAALVAQARFHGTATGLWLLLLITHELTGEAAPTGLEEAVRPGPLTRRALRGLRPTRLCLQRAANQKLHLATLLHWLCAPQGGAIALREVGRFLKTSEAALLDTGLAPGVRPGFWAGMRAAAYRARVALAAGGALARALLGI